MRLKIRSFQPIGAFAFISVCHVCGGGRSRKRVAIWRGKDRLSIVCSRCVATFVRALRTPGKECTRAIEGEK